MARKIIQTTPQPKKVQDISINFPPKSQWMNKKFIPTLENRDRYLIFLGGRGSGKSDHISKMIVLRLLMDKSFRGIAYRGVYNTLADSCFKSITDNIDFMQVSRFFTITKSPMRIICKLNKNELLFRGGDEPEKIKSIKDPNFLWIEEDLPETYSDFVTINQTLRSKKADYVQTIFSINPIVKGDYKEHWFYKSFNFEGQDTLDFSYEQEQELEGKIVKQKVTCVHSSWRNNKFLTPEYVADLELSSKKDTYLYAINSLGIWARKEATGNFYKNFNVEKNVKPYNYNNGLPLHLSFDFNLNPYITCQVWQIIGKTLYQVEEINLKTPNNYTKKLCEHIRDKYKSHTSGVYIYGDATGYASDTTTEQGVNNYSIIFDELDCFKPQDRTTRKNPSVMMRGQFINDILLNNYGGITLFFNPKAQNTLNDLMYGPEAEDGTKAKTKVKDKETGRTHEKYHHNSDAFDYLICSAFESDFNNFKNPEDISKLFVGGRIIKRNRW